MCMLCAEKPRLLALDMDGTLLTSDGKITVASRTAIRAAQAAGCEVVLATPGFAVAPVFDWLLRQQVIY